MLPVAAESKPVVPKHR